MSAENLLCGLLVYVKGCGKIFLLLFDVIERLVDVALFSLGGENRRV